jgi:LemA protein
MWIYIVTAIVVILLVAFISIYNALVRGRNQVKNAWAQIDVQLKRRYDLIPNLVETVKGYMKHERGTLEAVTQARNLAQQAASAGAGAREGKPELPRPAGRTDLHGEQDRVFAPVLQ